MSRLVLPLYETSMVFWHGLPMLDHFWPVLHFPQDEQYISATACPSSLHRYNLHVGGRMGNVNYQPNHF